VQKSFGRTPISPLSKRHARQKSPVRLTLRPIQVCAWAICSACRGRMWERMQSRLLTGKSRGRREAIIPLYDQLREVLARTPKHSPIILTNSHHRPWQPNGFGTASNRAKIGAGMNDRDLHFHDLRGTAATKFYIAGLSIRVVAEILAWSEDQ